MKKLSNGLTVVVSGDHSAPTFGLCISYAIGFRLEPQGRTGFVKRENQIDSVRRTIAWFDHYLMGKTTAVD
jgi:hypothetical protein